MVRGGRSEPSKGGPPGRTSGKGPPKKARNEQQYDDGAAFEGQGSSYTGQTHNIGQQGQLYPNANQYANVNGFTHTNHVTPNQQVQTPASPLDVLMSAIAATAGAAPQNGHAINMGGPNMGGTAQMLGMGNMNNMGNLNGMGGMGGMGGNNQPNSNGPPIQTQRPTASFDNSHNNALSLDQIFGNNAFSAAATAATSDPNPAALPTPFQVNLLMNLLNSQAGSNAASSMGQRSNQGQQAQHGSHAPSGNAFQQQAPPTPFQQTRSGRISRPPPQPAPFFPDWSQLQNGQNGNTMNAGVQAQGGGVYPSNTTMRAIQVLQQPGMEHIRQALASTEWISQMSDNAGQSGATTNYPGPVAPYSENVTPQGVSPAYSDGEDDSAPVKQGTKRRKRDSDGNGASSRLSGTSAAQGRDRSVSSSGFQPIDKGDDDVDGREDQERSQEMAAKFDWPKPPRGKGSRLALTQEEIHARRRERNKLSALRYREKRGGQIEQLQKQVEEKEIEIKEMQEKYDRLKQDYEDLKRHVFDSGLGLPNPTQQSTVPPATLGLQTTLVRSYSNQLGGAPSLPSLDIQQMAGMGDVQGPATSIASHTPISAPPMYNNDNDAPPSAGVFDSGGTGATNPINLFNNPLGNAGVGLSGQAAFDAGAEQLFDFNLFMNFDGFDDDDDEFQPETSPQNASGSESESDEDDLDEDGTPRASAKNGHANSKRKKASKRARAGRDGRPGGESAITPLYTDNEATPRDRDDEDFVDPEMEDEDLFLPIEDVPVPPEALASHSGGGTGEGDSAGAVMPDLTRDMMTALNVETRDQLAAVMRKLVESAGEGVGEDVREKLRSVMYLAQASVGPSQPPGQPEGGAAGRSDPAERH